MILSLSLPHAPSSLASAQVTWIDGLFLDAHGVVFQPVIAEAGVIYGIRPGI